MSTTQNVVSPPPCPDHDVPLYPHLLGFSPANLELQLPPSRMLMVEVPGLNLTQEQAKRFTTSLDELARRNATLLAGAHSSNIQERLRQAEAARTALINSLTGPPYGLRINPDLPTGKAINQAIGAELQQREDRLRLEALSRRAFAMGHSARTVQGLRDSMPTNASRQWLEFKAVHRDLLTRIQGRDDGANGVMERSYQAGIRQVSDAIDKAEKAYQRLNTALRPRIPPTGYEPVEKELREMTGLTYMWVERIHQANHNGQGLVTRISQAWFSGAIEFMATSFFAKNANEVLVKMCEDLNKLRPSSPRTADVSHLFGPAQAKSVEATSFEKRLVQLVGRTREDFRAALMYSSLQGSDPLLALLRLVRLTPLEERTSLLRTFRRLYCASAPSAQSDIDAVLEHGRHLRPCEREAVRELFLSGRGTPTSVQITEVLNTRASELAASQATLLASFRASGDRSENNSLQKAIIDSIRAQEQSFLEVPAAYFGNVSLSNQFFLNNLRNERERLHHSLFRRAALTLEYRITLQEEGVNSSAAKIVTEERVQGRRAALQNTLLLQHDLFTALAPETRRDSIHTTFTALNADLARIHSEAQHAYLHHSSTCDEIYTALHENSAVNDPGLWDAWCDVGTSGARLATALRKIRHGNDAHPPNSLLREIGVSDRQIVDDLYHDRYNLDVREDIRIDLGDCAESRMMLALHEGRQVDALVNEAHMILCGGHGHWFSDEFGSWSRTASFSPIAADKKQLDDLIRRYRRLSVEDRAEFERLFISKIIPQLSVGNNCESFEGVLQVYFTSSDTHSALFARYEGKDQLADAIETHELLNRGVPPVSEALALARSSCVGPDGRYDPERLRHFMNGFHRKYHESFVDFAGRRLKKGGVDRSAYLAFQELANAADLAENAIKNNQTLSLSEFRRICSKADAHLIHFALGVDGGTINYNLANTPIRFQFQPNEAEQRVLADLLKHGRFEEHRQTLESMTNAARTAQRAHNELITREFSEFYHEAIQDVARTQFLKQTNGHMRSSLFDCGIETADISDAQRLAEALSGIRGKRDMAVIRSVLENRFRTKNENDRYGQRGEHRRASIEELDKEFVAFMRENRIAVESLKAYGSRKLTGDDRFDFRNELVVGNAMTGSEMLARLERRRDHELSGAIGIWKLSVGGRYSLNSNPLQNQIDALARLHNRQRSAWERANPSLAAEQRSRNPDIEPEPVIYELGAASLEKYRLQYHVCQEASTNLRELKNAMAERVQMVAGIAMVTIAGFATGGAAWWVTLLAVSSTSLATAMLVKSAIRGNGYQILRGDWSESFGENSLLGNVCLIPIAYNLFTEEAKGDINHAAVEGIALTVTMGLSHAIANELGNRLVLLSMNRGIHGLTTAEILAGSFSKNTLVAMENELIKRAVSDFTSNIVVSLITETSGMMAAEYVSGIGMKFTDVAMEKGFDGLIANFGGALYDGHVDGMHRAAHAAYTAPMFVVGMRYIANPLLEGMSTILTLLKGGAWRSYCWATGIDPKTKPKAQNEAPAGAGTEGKAAPAEKARIGEGEPQPLERTNAENRPAEQGAPETKSTQEGRPLEEGRPVQERASAETSETGQVKNGAENRLDGESPGARENPGESTREQKPGERSTEELPGNNRRSENRSTDSQHSEGRALESPASESPLGEGEAVFCSAETSADTVLGGDTPAPPPPSTGTADSGSAPKPPEVRAEEAAPAKKPAESASERAPSAEAPARPIPAGDRGTAPEAAPARKIPDKVPETADGQREVLGIPKEEPLPNTLEKWNKRVAEALEQAKTPEQQEVVKESARQLMDPQRPQGSWSEYFFGSPLLGYGWRCFYSLLNVAGGILSTCAFRFTDAAEFFRSAWARLREPVWKGFLDAFHNNKSSAWDPNFHYRPKAEMLERARLLDPTLKEVPRTREEWLELAERTTQGLGSNEARAKVLAEIQAMMQEANAHAYWIIQTNRFRHMPLAEAEAYLVSLGIDPTKLPRTLHAMDEYLARQQGSKTPSEILKLREAAQAWFNRNGGVRWFGHYIAWPFGWSDESALMRLGLWDECLLSTCESIDAQVAHARQRLAEAPEQTADKRRDVDDMESAAAHVRRNYNLNNADPHLYHALRNLHLLGRTYTEALLRKAYDLQYARAYSQLRALQDEQRKISERVAEAKKTAAESSANQRQYELALNALNRINQRIFQSQTRIDTLHTSYLFLRGRTPESEALSWYNPVRAWKLLFGNSFQNFIQSPDLPSLDAVRRAFSLQKKAIQSSLDLLGDKNGARVLDPETIERLRTEALRQHSGNRSKCEDINLAALHLHLIARSRSISDVPTHEVLKARVEQFHNSMKGLGAGPRGKPYTAVEIDGFAEKLLAQLRSEHSRLEQLLRNRSEVEKLTRRLQRLETAQTKSSDSNRTKRIADLQAELTRLDAEFSKLQQNGETKKQLRRLISENLHQQRLVEANRDYVKDLLCCQAPDGTFQPRFDNSQLRVKDLDSAEGPVRYTHHVLQRVLGLKERLTVLKRRDSLIFELGLPPGASLSEVEAAIRLRHTLLTEKLEEMCKKGSQHEKAKAKAESQAKQLEDEMLRLLTEQQQALEALEEIRTSLRQSDPSLVDVTRDGLWMDQLVEISRRIERWQNLRRQVENTNAWSGKVQVRSKRDHLRSQTALSKQGQGNLTVDQMMKRLAELREFFTEHAAREVRETEARLTRQMELRRARFVERLKAASNHLADLDPRLLALLKAAETAELQAGFRRSLRRSTQLREILRVLTDDGSSRLIETILAEAPTAAPSSSPHRPRTLSEIVENLRNTHKTSLEKTYERARRNRASELRQEKARLEHEIRETNSELTRLETEKASRSSEHVKELRRQLDALKDRLAGLDTEAVSDSAHEAGRLAEAQALSEFTQQAVLSELRARARDFLSRTGHRMSAEEAKAALKEHLSKFLHEASKKLAGEESIEALTFESALAELNLREIPRALEELTPELIRDSASEQAREMHNRLSNEIEANILDAVEELTAKNASSLRESFLRESSEHGNGPDRVRLEQLIDDQIRGQLDCWRQAIDRSIALHQRAQELMREIVRLEARSPELEAIPAAKRFHERRLVDAHRTEVRRLKRALEKENARLERETEFGRIREEILRRRLHELEQGAPGEESARARESIERELRRTDWSAEKELLERRFNELGDENINAEVEQVRRSRRESDSEQAGRRRQQIEASSQSHRSRLNTLNNRYQQLTEEYIRFESERSSTPEVRRRQLKTERAKLRLEIRRIAETARGPLKGEVEALSSSEIELEILKIRRDAEAKLPENRAADETRRTLEREREAIRKSLVETDWASNRRKLHEKVERLRAELEEAVSKRELNRKLSELGNNRLDGEKRSRLSLSREYISRYSRVVRDHFLSQETARIESFKKRVRRDLKRLQLVEDQLLGRVDEAGERRGGLLEYSSCYSSLFSGDISTDVAIRRLGYLTGDALPDSPEAWNEAMLQKLDGVFDLTARVRIIEAGTKMMNESFNSSKRPAFWSEIWRAAYELSLFHGLVRMGEVVVEQIVWSAEQLAHAAIRDPWSTKLTRIGRVLFGDSFCFGRDLQWALDVFGTKGVSEFLVHELVVAREYGLKTTTRTRGVFFENWMLGIIPVPDFIPIRLLRFFDCFIAFPNEALRINLAREILFRHGNLNLADPNFARACHAIRVREHIGRLNALTESEIRYAARLERAKPGARLDLILAGEAYLCSLLPPPSDVWMIFRPITEAYEFFFPSRLINSTPRSQGKSFAAFERLGKLHSEGIRRAELCIRRTAELLGVESKSFTFDSHLSETHPEVYRRLLQAHNRTVWAEYEAAFSYLEQFRGGWVERYLPRMFHGLRPRALALDEFISFERLFEIHRNLDSAFRLLDLRSSYFYSFLNNVCLGDVVVFRRAERLLSELTGRLDTLEATFLERVRTLGANPRPQVIKDIRSEFLRQKNALLRQIREVSAARDFLMDINLHTRIWDSFRIYAGGEGLYSLNDISLLKERVETFRLRDRLNASAGLKTGRDHTPEAIQEGIKKARNAFHVEVAQARERAVEKAYAKLNPGEVFSANEVDLSEVNALLRSERIVRLLCSGDFLIEFATSGTRLRPVWEAEIVVTDKGILSDRINRRSIDQPFSEKRMQGYRDLMTVGEILGAPPEFAVSIEVSNYQKFEVYRGLYVKALENAKDMLARNKVEAAMSLVEDLLFRAVNWRSVRVDQLEGLSNRLRKIQERALALEMLAMNPEIRSFSAESVMLNYEAQLEKMPWMSQELGAARDHLLLLVGRKPRAAALKELGLKTEGRYYSPEDIASAYRRRLVESPAERASLTEARDALYELHAVEMNGGYELRWYERGGIWNPTTWPIINLARLDFAFNIIGDLCTFIRRILPTWFSTAPERFFAESADQLAFWRRWGWVRAEYQGIGLLENLSRLATKSRMQPQDAELLRFEPNASSSPAKGTREQLFHELLNNPKGFWLFLQKGARRSPVARDLQILELTGQSVHTRERGLMLRRTQTTSTYDVLSDPLKLWEHCERLITEAQGNRRRIIEILEAYNRYAANLKRRHPWRYLIIPPSDTSLGMMLDQLGNAIGLIWQDIPKFMLIMYLLTRFEFFRKLFGNWDLLGVSDKDFDDFMNRLRKRATKWVNGVEVKLSPDAAEDPITADSHGWWEDMDRRELEDPAHQRRPIDKSDFAAMQGSPSGIYYVQMTLLDEEGRPREGVNPIFLPGAIRLDDLEREQANRGKSMSFHSVPHNPKGRASRIEDLRLPLRDGRRLSDYFSKTRFPYLR